MLKVNTSYNALREHKQVNSASFVTQFLWDTVPTFLLHTEKGKDASDRRSSVTKRVQHEQVSVRVLLLLDKIVIKLQFSVYHEQHYSL